MGYYGRSQIRLFLAAVLVVLASVMVSGQGSGQVATCVSKLDTCASYLGGTTTPPSSCCTPLKDAVTNQKACLCQLYLNPALLKSLGVNITQAIGLSTRCKIVPDTDATHFCKGVAIGAPSGSPNANSTTSTPGGSTTGTGSGTGSATAITGTGLVSSLLMFVTYVVVY